MQILERNETSVPFLNKESHARNK